MTGNQDRMKNILVLTILLLNAITFAKAQDFESLEGVDADGQVNTFSSRSSKKDGKQNKVVPKGMYVWTVDPVFGERTRVDRDTLQYLFMNSIFTTGQYGQYNTTGNLGAPRLNRIFIDRKAYSSFYLVNPYDYFLTPVEQLRFTNTLSPITNLSYNTCGSGINGEDHLNAKFAVNAGKRIGAGMKFDYLYGRGYYPSQSTALFDWTFWASYLGERYQAHFAFSTDHMKMTENGGVANDEYITHPESFNENFSSSEIPTVLTDNWNRVNALRAFLTHRYSVGFYKKVPMKEEEIAARKFAIEAQKQKEEEERQAEAAKKGLSMTNTPVTGRPTDAKIMGDLIPDSTSAAETERVAVDSKEMADSLIAAETKVKEDTSWLKDEFVPVTSFIHTAKFDKYARKYQAYRTPAGFYRDEFNGDITTPGSDIKDPTDVLKLRNTFAVAMLEDFNKWAKFGLKAYLAHEIEHYSLIDTITAEKTYNENTVFAGAQLLKAKGHTFHYNVTGELGILGKNVGDLRVDFDGDVNVPLFGDTTRLLLNGFMHREKPVFMMRHFHSRNIWWDNDDLSAQLHTHLEGKISIERTRTVIRAAYDNIENYTYMAVANDRNDAGLPVNYTAGVRQTSRNISLVTAQVLQNFAFGKFKWENAITFQKSTEEDILPVPMLNVWTNLYLDFRIAKVLHCHLGAEAIYFTKYNAPEWCGQLMSYAVQENENVRTKVGNYPFVNVYANFELKGCRFFAMMSHVNAGQGSLNYFTTPHHPMNERIFRFGLSWYFNN